MRVRLKSRQKNLSKFQSEWFGPHEVISAKGVVVTLKALSSGRKYVTHNDRLSNPLLSVKDFALREIESNANPLENAREPEEDQLPRGDPEEVLMRTRSGRVVKPPRNIDFEYSYVIPCATQVTSFLSTSFVSCTSATVLHVSVAGLLQNPTTSAARMNDNRIRREQRARLEALGERVCWVLDLENTNTMAILLKKNGTLFFLEIQRIYWICPFDNESLTNVLKHDPWPRP